MSKLKSGRLILDEGAIAALSSMYDELKDEKCIKITPSKLGSWIISEFKKSHFSSHKAEITKDHFNSKEYLKGLMENIKDEDDLEEVLKTSLQKLTPKKQKRRNAKVESQQST